MEVVGVNENSLRQQLKIAANLLWQAFYVAPQLEPVVPVGGPMLLPRRTGKEAAPLLIYLAIHIEETDGFCMILRWS